MKRVCKHQSKCIRAITRLLRQAGAEVAPPTQNVGVHLSWVIAGIRMTYSLGRSLLSRSQTVKHAVHAIRRLFRQHGLQHLVSGVTA